MQSYLRSAKDTTYKRDYIVSLVTFKSLHFFTSLLQAQLVQLVLNSVKIHIDNLNIIFSDI